MDGMLKVQNNYYGFYVPLNGFNSNIIFRQINLYFHLKQYITSINLDFASLTPDIKRIQTSHVELAELDSNNENLISYVCLPFMISTVHLGNRLDEFIVDSTDSNEAIIEATQFTTASIETLKPLFLALIEACRTNYDSKINYQEWMLCILLIVAGLLTIIWYIIAIYTMLDIINKKHNILATFSYVTPNEIEKIIGDV